MEPKYFKNKEEFYQFLEINHHDHPGIWIKFDKRHMKDKLKPEEALDIALCFGWIDGIIKRIDDDFYLKYFTKRLDTSVWSTKNKKSIERLIKDGLMKPAGLLTVEKAKKDGRWDKADQPPLDYSFDEFMLLIKPNNIAYQNFIMMSKSVQKTYAMSYFILKKQESREKRLTIIIQRLVNNSPPM